MPHKIVKKKDTPRKNAFLSNSNVALVHGGKEFFIALKTLINEASSSLHLQTYIFAEDSTGREIADTLISAAKRNISVYILVDGFASQGLSKEFIHKLEDAGIRFRFFEPLLKSPHFYLGRRLHHKVVVADKKKALIGSMNIADRYNDPPEGKPWFDMALYIEGSACTILDNICWDLWNRRSPSRNATPNEKRNSFRDLYPVALRIRRNDWVSREQDIYRTYASFFRHAKTNITIACSYFLPGATFRHLLKLAARRGVKVNLVLAQISDVKTAKNAERYLYRWLMRNNINVYEYKPAVLHAKLAIVDASLLTLGSYNLNQLSKYASIELNIDVKDESFARKVQDELETIIARDCEAIDLSSYRISLLSFHQLLQWFSYFFLRILLVASTFYYRQKD